MNNDKLMIKIKDLEVELNKKKSKEKELKQSFLDLEERNDVLLGEH